MTPRHRHLAELCSPLPLDSQPSGAVSQLPVESQPAWLDLSNRAFMAHPRLHARAVPGVIQPARLSGLDLLGAGRVRRHIPQRRFQR